MSLFFADLIVAFAIVLIYRINRNIFISSGIFGMYGFISRSFQNSLLDSLLIGLASFAMTFVFILLLRGLRRFFA